MACKRNEKQVSQVVVELWNVISASLCDHEKVTISPCLSFPSNEEELVHLHCLPSLLTERGLPALCSLERLNSPVAVISCLNQIWQNDYRVIP